MRPNNSQPAIWRVFSIFLILLPLTAAISSCALTFTPQIESTPSPAPEDLTPPLVDITFQLQIAPEFYGQSRIAIEILDEVTGLPYNPKRYDLSQVREDLLQVTLPFSSGSVIKYRYVKISGGFQPEANLDGEAIRYRMYFASIPDTVNDVFQSWEGQARTIETGTLTGLLTDPISNEPIADILVNAAGMMTFTDANGRFTFHNLPDGVHNIVFYAIDGQYKTFQQGATISEGLVTPADIVLLPMPKVTVTFIIRPPNDALGVPIYLAGNLIQLGNTFTDLPGGMSLKPKRMPMLSPLEDGTQTISLSLHAETDLRFKFTLGDGYWNAEQRNDVNHVIRQLIVPNHDVTLTLDIESWRTPGFEPITFQVQIPPENSPGDEKYIQFQTAKWTEPIPLWNLGNGNYLYILFSPFDPTTALNYRFCRNENCDRATAASPLPDGGTVQPGTAPQTLSISLTEWNNWQKLTEPADVAAAEIPLKEGNFVAGIELTPEMDPSWPVYAPYGLASITEIDASMVIFRPTWTVNQFTPAIFPRPGKTPFKSDLVKMLNDAQSLGLNTALFPTIDFYESREFWWGIQAHDEGWWTTWFGDLQQFLLNYAQIASDTNSDSLIIGGKDLLPAIPGGVYPDGSPSTVPASSEGIWREILSEIRKVYGGKIVWATTINQESDPLPPFLDAVDAVYVAMDTPLGPAQTISPDEISIGFEDFAINTLGAVYQDTNLPLIVALGYPSVTNSHQGCLLVSDTCESDALFLPGELSPYSQDLNQQATIYNEILPAMADQPWISGIVIRGYQPTVEIFDNSSSIAGKPAEQVIWYWFEGLK